MFPLTPKPNVGYREAKIEDKERRVVMGQGKTNTIRALVLLVGFLCFLPSVAGDETKKRTCGPQPGKTIEQFLNELNPGDTLLLSGTCNENVAIGEGHRNITLDGQGVTTINAPVSTSAAILVRGRGVTIRGFAINGGRHGVQISRGGSATVDGNMIQNATAHGISVVNGSSARIVDNTVQGNGETGIQITESASADIGFIESETDARPNTIMNNGSSGIGVSDASHAEIEANTIKGNVSSGILVSGSSSARIGFRAGVPGSFESPNVIEGNTGSGISISRSSSARISTNSIKSNLGGGISVTDNSTADISPSAETGIANTIEGNGGADPNRRDGVSVGRSSSARIVGNSIINNTRDGVRLFRSSQADISGNTINGNQQHGINMFENSGVNLDLANSGANGVGPGFFGLRCRTGSYASGTIGTLTGTSGAKSFGATLTLTTADTSPWGPVDDGDGTTLTVTGTGTVSINSQGCMDNTTP